jgi:hypothetical protein
MNGDVIADGGFQFFHAAENAAANALVGELSSKVGDERIKQVAYS